MLDKLREKVESYTPIEDEDWEHMKKKFTVVKVKKKEVLVSYAELNKNLFFIASGSFEISLVFQSGKSKTVWFFLDEPTKYEITAIEDSTVIKFSYGKLELLTKEYPYLNEFMRKDVLNGLVYLFEIRNHMASHTPIDFIKYLKEKYPIILDRIPDKNIAGLMGITPEWYSKMQRKLNTLN